MAMRKGLGKGQGSGYHNIIGKDPAVHSQSAKGVKQPQQTKTIKKTSLSDVEKKAYDELGMSAFLRLKNYLSDQDWKMSGFEEVETGIYKMQCGNAEFMLFSSENKAKQFAKEMVMRDLEEQPQVFDTSFVKRHMYIDEADKRMIAGDDAVSQIEKLKDEFTNKQFLEKYGDYDSYENIQNKKEKLVEQEEKADSGMQKKIIDKKVDRFEQRQDYLIDEAVEKARKQLFEENLKKLTDNPVEYFTDKGREEKNVLNKDIMKINIEQAADEALKLEGWEHFIDNYDGSPTTLNYVVNGITESLILARKN